jgi:hypothetical protein
MEETITLGGAILESLQLSGIYHTEKEKLIKNAPYHLNIIDELHANENSHSRILVKILQYQGNNRHVNLDSYDFTGAKPAHCIYHDKWNGLFAENMDSLVDLFYKNISKVFDVWKVICNENQISE